MADNGNGVTGWTPEQRAEFRAKMAELDKMLGKAKKKKRGPPKSSLHGPLPPPPGAGQPIQKGLTNKAQKRMLQQIGQENY